jgi:hypothetical protein
MIGITSRLIVDGLLIKSKKTIVQTIEGDYMAIKCCFNCTKRNSGCHAICEQYKKEREKWERHKEQIKKVKEKETCYFDRFKYWR